ncbi:MAG: permease [Elainellaceae cyanobacterium]
MGSVSNGLTLFFSLIVEAMPFLLMGILLSSALLLFVDERRLVAAMPRNPVLGALAGSLFGFLFPVCECGNVPVARRLIIQGAPASVAVGFLLAAPTVNPIVLWATWTAFRDQPELAVLRIVFSIVIATIVGCVFSTQKDLRPLLQGSVSALMPDPPASSESQGKGGLFSSSSSSSSSPLLRSGTFLLGQGSPPRRMDYGMAFSAAANPALTRPFPERLQLMVENMVQELRELGGMLMIGSAIAAIVQVGLPREVILSLGQGPVTSILTMMVLAWVVSICSTVDAFFALSFASTFTSGSLLAFMVFGPMIDVKNIGLLLSVFRWRAIVYLFALAAQLTFVSTLVINLYFS